MRSAACWAEQDGLDADFRGHHAHFDPQNGDRHAAKLFVVHETVGFRSVLAYPGQVVREPVPILPPLRPTLRDLERPFKRV
jgi:hypothetical protein